jgi:adenylosuccinate lyase
MMGRSHGIHAEPITFGLKMAIWYEELGRAVERIERARESVAVGKLSGAVGTYSNIPPEVEEYVCQKLGLRPAAVSTQIVQRDRHAEYMLALALTASSIEKFAVETRHLQRTEVGEIEESFTKGQKGSSAMPHKKNPILSENLSGLARLIRGYGLSAMENVPLWHERDISHSSVERVILPDATILMDFMLHRFTGLIEGLVVHSERMLKNMEITGGTTFSQKLLLVLVDSGMSREDAYRVVQKNAMESVSAGRLFADLIREDPEIQDRLRDDQITEIFDPESHLKNTGLIFDRVFSGEQ